ncbi:rhomboid family intramembrane serine protease [Fundidesulfovibrio butyratiphilus]
MPLLLPPRGKPWPDVGPDILALTGASSLSRAEARQFSLVLWAKGVPHRMKPAPQGVRLLVRPGRKEEALAEIEAYLRENPAAPDHPVEAHPRGSFWRQLPGVLWSLGAALVFLTATGARDGLGAFSLNWYTRGVGDTGLMLKGQWWRAVTALCLHADVGHLMGNVCLGGVFLALLAGEVGLGPAWLLTLASGACGNLAKAWLQGAGSHFLGASTAVFGGLGVLAGFRVAKSRSNPRWKRALPFAAGLMILAMLGVGSEEEARTIDLAGHFFGFGAGCLLGAVWAAGNPAGLGPEGPAGAWFRFLCGVSAVCLVLTCWASAFLF